MIEHIKNIGKYVRENKDDIDMLDFMVKKINSKDIKYILPINIDTKKDGITVERLKDFYEDVVKDALFYQAGNGLLGGGIRLDYYKESSVKKICKFCEIKEKEEEIKNIIENYLKENDKNTFFIVNINNKTPRELFENKFMNTMYSTTFNEVKGNNKCHLCSSEGKCFNSAVYKFYTNDKGIYSNIDSKDKNGIVICKDCLENLIVGKKYIEDNLITYWLKKSVMFLPHNYNKKVAKVYERDFEDDKGTEKLLKSISSKERQVVRRLSETQSLTDMIFYEQNNQFFGINHSIVDILPSRFSKISKLLDKYDDIDDKGKFSLYSVIKYCSSVKVSGNELKTTDKEELKILSSIFKGTKIDRNLFFKRVMQVYKHNYVRGNHKKFACIKNINKIYNFLCECSCLEKGWNVLKTYSSYEQLFDDNINYFDSNEKKAWFILGRAYSNMIYQIKTKLNEENSKTSLEKNFLFARRFDFNDFIYFSNLLTDKIEKYKVESNYLKNMISEAKLLMANKENKISQDEAKYIFAWGKDSYFEKEKNESEVE
ncbi:TIGR02556 family CRISPR-associated protein [Tepidibacter formicigenes]|jgi:CRISPR-associated protein Csh1|uniref:CRISPR-associated protein Csh1 n=1 Tax=Tepidibacter formicigenes DSM 15518 TaxID=1123349 RepID=A0A1M6LMJ4_9FIRM|nr:TIGR02556 family CRISPR-associated protein [Tepidibacter formicigenes]SHJ72427.1 CRISPR-associated protein Csh1 [Tepidibacter formicigenes DSM 15518]